MASIFLDESGHFGKSRNHEEYFIVGSFTVGEPKRTAKGFKQWCKTHFPKKMAKRSEIKWSSSGVVDKLRLRTLKQISKLDVRIRYVYFLKSNIPAEYRDGDRYKDGLLYTNVIGELLEMYLPNTDSDFRIYCDKRQISGITSSQFKEILKARILPGLPAKVLFQIDMVDSATNINIQIADWIAGALARYHEDGRLGKEFYAILKGNLVGGDGKELFNTPSYS